MLELRSPSALIFLLALSCLLLSSLLITPALATSVTILVSQDTSGTPTTSNVETAASLTMTTTAAQPSIILLLFNVTTGIPPANNGWSSIVLSIKQIASNIDSSILNNLFTVGYLNPTSYPANNALVPSLNCRNVPCENGTFSFWNSTGFTKRSLNFATFDSGISSNKVLIALKPATSGLSYVFTSMNAAGVNNLWKPNLFITYDPCSPNATVVNHVCVCNSGLVGDGFTCNAPTCPANTTGFATWPSSPGNNQVVTGTCLSGYAGNPQRVCTSAGTWNSPTSTCTEVDCPSDTAGFATWSPIIAQNQSVSGTCLSGYYGTPTRNCYQLGAVGSWGSVNNPCQQQQCPADTTANAAFGGTYATGQSVSGTCVSGYYGTVSRVCNINSTPNSHTGIWSAITGTCNQQICPSESIGNGVFSDSYADGQVLGGTCDSGYYGTIFRTCDPNPNTASPNGTWSAVTGTCDAVYCSAETFANATWLRTQAFGQSVTGTCLSGLIGTPTRVCLQDFDTGVWQTLSGDCHPPPVTSLNVTFRITNMDYTWAITNPTTFTQTLTDFIAATFNVPPELVTIISVTQGSVIVNYSIGTFSPFLLQNEVNQFVQNPDLSPLGNSLPPAAFENQNQNLGIDASGSHVTLTVPSSVVPVVYVSSGQHPKARTKGKIFMTLIGTESYKVYILTQNGFTRGEKRTVTFGGYDVGTLTSIVLGTYSSDIWTFTSLKIVYKGKTSIIGPGTIGGGTVSASFNV